MELAIRDIRTYDALLESFLQNVVDRNRWSSIEMDIFSPAVPIRGVFAGYMSARHLNITGLDQLARSARGVAGVLEGPSHKFNATLVLRSPLIRGGIYMRDADHNGHDVHTRISFHATTVHMADITMKLRMSLNRGHGRSYVHSLEYENAPDFEINVDSATVEKIDQRRPKSTTIAASLLETIGKEMAADFHSQFRQMLRQELKNVNVEWYWAVLAAWRQ